MARLRERERASAKALELLVLTAARTGEIIGSRWEEFDLEAATWTVPGSRMKAGVEHVVPLSDAALAILVGLPRKGDHVFINGNDRAMSDMAMLQLMKGMNVDATPHGMRSAFNTWAKNQPTSRRRRATRRLLIPRETRSGLHQEQKPPDVRQEAALDGRMVELTSQRR